MFLCKKCKKNSAVKAGLRKNKVGFTQRYVCRNCNTYQVNRKGFENFRHNSEVITAALDLRAKALSLAQVVDHLDQHHRVKVSRTTILDWQNKFGKKVESFTQTLKPKIDGDVHADEVFLKVKGEWNYFWDAMDYVTKFVVGKHFSTIRDRTEATQFLTNVKETAGSQIWRIHTDNSFDYPLPMKRVFGKDVIHQHYPAWKKHFRNNPIERFHNSLKEPYKTMRGFCTVNDAESFTTFWTNYYNFIRKHMSLGMQTPAQAAKIELNLGRNRFRSMIEILHTFFKVQIWHLPN
jgi:transposase-like protein